MKAKIYFFMNVLSVLLYIALLSYAIEKAGISVELKEGIIFISLITVDSIAFLVSFYKLNEII